MIQLCYKYLQLHEQQKKINLLLCYDPSNQDLQVEALKLDYLIKECERELRCD